MSHFWIRRLFSRFLPKATRARLFGKPAESIKRKWTAHNLSVEQLEDRVVPSNMIIFTNPVPSSEPIITEGAPATIKLGSFQDNTPAYTGTWQIDINWG